MNTSTMNFTEEALLLPVEARIALVDKLLESINPHGGQALDAFWAEEADKRAIEIESGAVRALNGEKVFAQIRQRLAGA